MVPRSGCIENGPVVVGPLRSAALSGAEHGPGEQRARRAGRPRPVADRLVVTPRSGTRSLNSDELARPLQPSERLHELSGRGRRRSTARAEHDVAPFTNVCDEQIRPGDPKPVFDDAVLDEGLTDVDAGEKWFEELVDCGVLGRRAGPWRTCCVCSGLTSGCCPSGRRLDSGRGRRPRVRIRVVMLAGARVLEPAVGQPPGRPDVVEREAPRTGDDQQGTLVRPT